MRAYFNRRLVQLTAAALGTLAVCLTSATSGEARSSEDDDAPRSLVGSYLAGRFARTHHDSDKAADFYRLALTRDPGNEILLEQAFLTEATDGNWPRATVLAEELVTKQPSNRMALVVLGLTDFKAGKYEEADEHFKAAGNGPIGELTSALARAWVAVARGDTDGALALLDLPKQADWAQYYLRYHRALIADVTGRTQTARAAYERVFRQDKRTLRTLMAYARHAASAGDQKLAVSILNEHLGRAPNEGHPLVRRLLARIEAGEHVGIIVSNPTDGLSEVFYGLGEALTGEGGISIGMLYLQMALYLTPEQPLALWALAGAHEATKQYNDAIAIYDRIPKGSGLESSILIRKAYNLNSLDRVDDAKALLLQAVNDDPTDLKPLDALGSIMRARKRYEEAAEYYTRAIDQIGKPEKRHWTYYYSRGTCFERLKKWPAAEADLKKALKLSPDQPLVLNYLGYSWIDQGRNLKHGMALIEKAVALKPDDGYIVDSLGWAHYRIGNYKEAVQYLERAVELRPEDPVLNDHLGDALWRVGREREARYQWEQALTLQPEPEDAERMRRKLASGLTKTHTNVVRKAKEAARAEEPKKLR